MLNQVLKVFTGIRQHSFEVLSKSVTFFDFWLSQGSVATYCRLCGNLCDAYRENVLTNHLVKGFWKLVHNCQIYYQISRGLVFLENGVYKFADKWTSNWDFKVTIFNVKYRKNTKKEIVTLCWSYSRHACLQHQRSLFLSATPASPSPAATRFRVSGDTRPRPRDVAHWLLQRCTCRVTEGHNRQAPTSA